MPAQFWPLYGTYHSGAASLSPLNFTVFKGVEVGMCRASLKDSVYHRGNNQKDDEPYAIPVLQW